MEKVIVVTECQLSERSHDPYYHPFQKGEVVEVIGRKNPDVTDRYIHCINGKETSYLSEHDVEDLLTHQFKKNLGYAEDFKEDLTHDYEKGEDSLIQKKDVETIGWLVEQAKRAEMYKSCLELIVKRNGHGLSAVLLAQLSLKDADDRFSQKNREVLA